MTGLLEVREFDKITCNGDLKDQYAYLPEKVFNELKLLIQTSSADSNGNEILNLVSINYLRNAGEVLSIKNFVGILQLPSGFQIQILPKIDFGNNYEDNTKKTKYIFLSMLKSLRNFPGKTFNEASINVSRMPVYEIFISMYLQEVKELIRKGLKSAYLDCEDNLNVFKGKLLIKEHLKHNLAHAERFYASYDEYSINRAENRLIKATLLKLNKKSANSENQKLIHNLLNNLEMITPSVNYLKDFSQVVTDRNTTGYKKLIDWSKVFLLNKSLSTFSGSNTATSLLFPMEKLFESYVAQQLKIAIASQNWHISFQDRKYHLFDEPRQFALRPDIVITKENKTRVVLDTKWKYLKDEPSGNYGISQQDMYQMYAYSKKYNARDVWLIYPQNNEEFREYKEISFRSNDDVKVNIFFVNLADIQNSLGHLVRRI